ncbi:MAG: type II toxin-antitoxin system mRNA interferase toxin, RelE/StbE family [Robiginitomaculum sp.]|nr:MAG: type II toxin-antitoxin system mRNA interferase toxin, RelE/StbE family [Robiginitomaculum sp.]
MKIEWTETAIIHLKHVRDYMSEDDPYAAERVGVAIYSAANILIEYPGAGRVGRVPNTRELIVSRLPFIIPYTVVANRVIILAVMHTSLKWPKRFD